MWLAVLSYFHRVTLVRSQTNVVPRPSFLFHAHPEDQRQQRDTAQLPRRREDAGTMPSAGTAGASSVAGTAGASSSSRSAAAAGGGSNEPSRNVRSRRPSAQNSLRTLYTTPFGGKCHVDRNCHGLRNASQVAVTPRCPRCGPQSEIPRWELYAIGHGYELHVSYEHCRDYGSNRPLRRITPCAICCSDADMYT